MEREAEDPEKLRIRLKTATVEYLLRAGVKNVFSAGDERVEVDVFAMAKRSLVETRLARLGLKLRPPLSPAGKYVGAKAANDIVYVCGQGPITILPNGERLVPRGKVGREFTLVEGYEAAKLCALNCLSQLKAMIGDLDRVESVLKVVGYINSADGFELQAKVLNGCTELLGAIFGEEAGVPARSAIAVSVEGWIPCETDMIVKLKA